MDYRIVKSYKYEIKVDDFVVALILQILTLLSIQSRSLVQVECYSRNFMKYCTMVDKAKYVTDRISSLRREMTTHDFRNVLQNYTIDIKEIICMIIERRICMFRVKSCNYQSDCLPYFETLLNIVHSCFYAVLETKNAHLVEVSIFIFSSYKALLQ